MKDLIIGYGVLGSALTLKEENVKHTNGSADYFYCLKILSRIKNIKKIVLLSKSDYEKLLPFQKSIIDPFGKIVNPYSEIELPSHMFSKVKEGQFKTTAEAQFSCIHELKNYIKNNNINIDFNILYYSQGATNWNIPNAKKTKNNEGNIDLCMTFNYAAPIVEYLNNSNVPWTMLFPDPRWIKSSEQFGNLIDLFNLPKFLMGQSDVTLPWRHVLAYDPTKLTTEFKYEHDKFNCQYGEIEKVNGFGKKITDPSSPRENEFTIVAMQSSGENSKHDYRYDQLKKWILDIDKENKFDIYGKWDESYTKNHQQFKGLKTKEELGEILKKTKYTLVIPLRKKWSSYKYIEMLLNGVVPFFHPDYDTSNYIVSADNFLRLKSPEDFKKKIDFLNSHDEERIKLVKKLQDRLLSEIVSGQFFPKILNKLCKENNIDIEFDEVDNNNIVTSKKKFFF